MHEQDGRSYVDLLQDIMEKIIVLSLASGQKRLSKSLSKLVENYAELLASQGLLSTAMEYLKLLGSKDSSLELTILRDRIALCTEERGISNLPFEESPQQHDHVHNIGGSTSSAVNGSQHYYQDNSQVQQQQPTSSGQYGDGYQQNFGSYGGYSTQVPQQGQQFLGYTNPVQYQPTQSSFQPTQSSFQPTQPSFQPTQPSFQPTQSSFQPTQSSFQPTQSSFQPTQSSFQPTQSSFQPTQSSFQPTQSSFQPTQSSFQPTQSPHMFIPSQTHQVPQQNYGQPPAPAQPVVRPFVPTNPPALRNADQYQQPHTLGSQLYPGVPSQNYQTGAVPATGPPPPGSIPGHRFPQPGTAPVPRNFMPVTSSSFGHTAGFNAIQPSSPTQKVQQPVAAPPAPLPTVQTVDTSKVSAELRPVIGTLTRLYQETSESLGQRADPAKKREIEDNSRKIGALFAKLNSGDISLNASSQAPPTLSSPRLRGLCQCFAYPGAIDDERLG
ncbi:hypothetical protein KSP39_PZI017551 [Platanthera zijinensis]|uniref:Uncharacterized protein n=1 Tax=Platanthera zijinensis TaxID=2320716 RepID=A0AAP0G074_9ASPA